jgi:hypothetical protein
MGSNIQDRIKEIVDKYYKGNASAAARELDILQGTFKQVYMDKEYKPSYENLVKILSNKNLNINPQWLIFGRGEMNTSSVVSAPVEPYGINYKEKWIELLEQLNDVRKELAESKEEVRRLNEIIQSAKNDMPNVPGNVRGVKAS